MMDQVIRFVVDKVGGIGAAIGAAIGYWYWGENATLNCSGFGQDVSCAPGAAYALDFAGGLWGRPEFTGMTMFVGAVLWLAGAAAYRTFAPTHEV